MSKTLAFTVFCMESYKEHRALNGREVNCLFRKYNVYAYLRECYDVLHTTGYQYINNDIDCFIAARSAMAD